MNPAVHSGCDNLLAGNDYCVGPVNGTTGATLLVDDGLCPAASHDARAGTRSHPPRHDVTMLRMVRGAEWRYLQLY
jgi:hypothetical protein